MSIPNGQFPTSNYLCHNCGRQNSLGIVCIQCQSIIQTSSNIETNTNPNSGSIDRFENFNPQVFTNMLLPLLMPQRQSDFLQYRHRRGRPSRRIKRVAYRYIPSSSLFNNQLIIFDPNERNSQSRLFTQLITDDFNLLSHRNFDINQLPTLTMNPSNLLLYLSCAICLENFNSFSEVKQLPICQHVFHTNCLTEWLRQHHNCPMCRSNISSIEQRSNSILNDQWIEQFLFQSFQSNLTYPSIKTIDLIPISDNPIESTSSESDIPQLPRFDSSSNHE